jgi:hypothetical protein
MAQFIVFVCLPNFFFYRESAIAGPQNGRHAENLAARARIIKRFEAVRGGNSAMGSAKGFDERWMTTEIPVFCRSG